MILPVSYLLEIFRNKQRDGLKRGDPLPGGPSTPSVLHLPVHIVNSSADSSEGEAFYRGHLNSEAATDEDIIRPLPARV